VTPESESTGRRVSFPANVSIGVLTALSWMSRLDVMIAAESDAGRQGMAKEIGKLRSEIAELLAPELRLEGEK
jgi:hypothetical protein